MLADCGRREQRKIKAKIDELKTDPRIGKPLVRELIGFRRLVAASRYRVVYHLAEKKNNKTATVVAIGIRKQGDRNDIYALAKKLKAQGQLLD